MSRSLLDMHPNTMLARSASEQWLQNPDAEVFVERDGIRFGYVLDYLRDDGSVILPMTVPKPSFLADLVYYGVENVDESKIDYRYNADTRFLAHAVYELHTENHAHVSAAIRAEIKAFDFIFKTGTFAEECANTYSKCGGKLKINIHGPNTTLLKSKEITLCPHEMWMDLLSLLCDEGTGMLPLAQVECNKLLSRVGLEIVSAVELPDKCIIQVVMKLTSI